VRIKRTVGDVVAVPLGDGRFGYGLVLKEPLLAFFDLLSQAGEHPRAEDIVRSRVLFRIWVANRPVIDGTWPVLANVTVPEALLEPPWFFKLDPISKKLTMGRTGTEELPLDPQKVGQLERMAVWSAVHVVARLQDHFDGRPDKHAKSVSPER
jgi:hypothetical protein